MASTEITTKAQLKISMVFWLVVTAFVGGWIACLYVCSLPPIPPIAKQAQPTVWSVPLPDAGRP
ncbi:hypothetical protein [Saccharopolyspora taberi]|uniref:Uncharacterized protein n=1 Tax=Saccharopolyspora taberi TaxID=60895 RepID=A0ABN3V1J2_9PSEU